MAKINLTIEASNVDDLRNTLAVLLGSTALGAVVAAGGYEDEETAAPAQPIFGQDGAAPAAAPEKPKRGAAKKAAEPQAATTASPPADASSGATTDQPSEPAAPATSPADPPVVAPAAAGEITLDMLKAEMTELLKKKSAAVAQQTLRDATQKASLSALDPAEYPAAFAALKKAQA